MWHLCNRMDEEESEDGKIISLKEIHVPKQLLVLERVMLMYLWTSLQTGSCCSNPNANNSTVSRHL